MELLKAVTCTCNKLPVHCRATCRHRRRQTIIHSLTHSYGQCRLHVFGLWEDAGAAKENLSNYRENMQTPQGKVLIPDIKPKTFLLYGDSVKLTTVPVYYPILKCFTKLGEFHLSDISFYISKCKHFNTKRT